MIHLNLPKGSKGYVSTFSGCWVFFTLRPIQSNPVRQPRPATSSKFSDALPLISWAVEKRSTCWKQINANQQCMWRANTSWSFHESYGWSSHRAIDWRKTSTRLHRNSRWFWGKNSLKSILGYFRFCLDLAQDPDSESVADAMQAWIPCHGTSGWAVCQNPGKEIVACPKVDVENTHCFGSSWAEVGQKKQLI